MFSSGESLPAAVESTKERDLRPLVEESAEVLNLDSRQLKAMESSLHDAWFFGVRTGLAVMTDTTIGQNDPHAVILRMQDEFQEQMESLGDALGTTVGATIQAWDYLGQAWIAGARFWEVEIAARLVEARSGGLDEVLRKLGEAD